MLLQKRVLGFWMLTSLVVGNMIGAGIFLLPSLLGQYGSIGIIGWILSSFGALCLACVFAKLGYLYPKIGGPYAYCKEAFGDFIGFCVISAYWMSVWISNTAVILVLVGYLSFFFPVLSNNPNLSFMTGTAIIWIIIAINIIGVKQVGMVQLATTILKLIPLLLIIVVGLFFVQPHYLTVFHISPHSHFSALSQTIMLTFWSFLGLESATIPADKVEKPTLNIPRATIIGVFIATTIYILSTTIIMGIIPMDVLAKSQSPFADVAQILFGPWGGAFIALGAIVSIFGALNGWFLIQVEIALAASQDKLFPGFFSKITKRGRPVFGLTVSGILMTVLLALTFKKGLLVQFSFIVSLSVIAVLIPFLYTSMAEIVFLFRYQKHFPRTRIAKSIVVASLSFVYIIWIIMGSEEKNVFYCALFLFSCIPVYVWIKWKQLRNKLRV